MKKVSVIVPIYNSDMYLKICLDSLVKQTYRNIEIILIDDGSTDDSGKICDEYAVQDKRVVVAHIVNHGVSYARNQGIKIATGDYVMFVDSDDYLDSRFIEKMIRPLSIKKYDLILCRCSIEDCNTNNSTEIITKLEECTCNLTEDYWLLMDFIGGPVMKLYNKKIIDVYGLSFPVNIKYSEDRIFNTNFYNYVHEYCFVNEALYHIVNRNFNSLSKQLCLKNFLSAVYELEYTSKFLIKNDFKNKDVIINNRIVEVIGTFACGNDYTYSKYKEIVTNIKYLISDNLNMVGMKRRIILGCISLNLILIVYCWYRYKRYFTR